jgi:hypothetical protein
MNDNGSFCVMPWLHLHAYLDSSVLVWIMDLGTYGLYCSINLRIVTENLKEERLIHKFWEDDLSNL